MIGRLLQLPVRAYRAVLSPLKPRCCRFVPTCSEYALHALQKRNPAAALLLVGWRLLRCHPFAEPGYDPVPERGLRRVR